MKILLKLVLPLALALYLMGSAGAYYNPGKPWGYINDFAGKLSKSTVVQLHKELEAFDKATSRQISVVIIPSMEKDSQTDYIEHFAVKLFEDWKVGRKGLDNGVLFLISLEERAARIEVGYGLEGILTDSRAAEILNNVAQPYFKTDDFDAGVVKSVQAIENIIKDEVVDFSGAPTGAKSKNFGNYLEIIFVWGFWMVVILSRFLINFFAKSKEWWPGGVIGGIIGIALGLILFSAIGYFVILVFAALTGGGFLFDYLASSGKIKPPGKGGGGFWFLGGGGGGLGGGGFGGFGGGRSGGGGASGGW